MHEKIITTNANAGAGQQPLILGPHRQKAMSAMNDKQSPSVPLTISIICVKVPDCYFSQDRSA